MTATLFGVQRFLVRSAAAPGFTPFPGTGVAGHFPATPKREGQAAGLL
jgi:hypothetical protein